MNTIPEFSLLCALLNPYTQWDDILPQLVALTDDEWNQVIKQARNQGVLLRLYQSLVSANLLNLLPEGQQSELKNSYLQNAARNLLVLRHASHLLENLHAHGIATIGLKGIYLIENVNHSIAERFLGDIDLLVKKSDLALAIECIRLSGFRSNTYFDLSDQDSDIKHVPPMFNQEGLAVEIHWTLIEEDEPFAIDTNGLWQRSVQVKIAGVDCSCLSCEDLILHLCLHSTYQHHLSLGLKGLVDLVDVFRYFEGRINWENLSLTASAWKVERITWLTFNLLNIYFHLNIPQEVMSALRPPLVEDWVLDQAKAQVSIEDRFRTGMTPDLAKLSQSQGIINRIRIGLGRVFLSRQVIARLYNIHPGSPMILLGYVRRIRDLARVYGRTVRDALTNDAQLIVSAEAQQARNRLRGWLSEENPCPSEGSVL